MNGLIDADSHASVIIVALGIGLGIMAGLRPGALDTSMLVVTAVSEAIPAVGAAIVLITLFAVKLGWFPARWVIQRHIVRNAAIPITTITGITIA